tara:strand:- start:632 stop:1414 length:783 start_codon:yes stop_codon:yes gene_type:complete
MNLFSKIILKISRKLGYNIQKIQSSEEIYMTYDDIYKKIFNQKIIIFDVGANKGQSIERFFKNFPKAIIHCFEPVEKEFIYLKKNYGHLSNIYLNNFALGEKSTTKDFFVNAKSSTSSFNKLTKKTRWLKLRSKENKINSAFFSKRQKVKISTADEYCKDNKINKIDILKIDTQGHEDKVLIGCKKLLKNEKISAIELEVMFDNVYDRHLTFTEVEKNLINNNYRFAGIETCNNNLFENILFFGDLLYIKNGILKSHIKK